jgi:hypothetical protein
LKIAPNKVVIALLLFAGSLQTACGGGGESSVPTTAAVAPVATATLPVPEGNRIRFVKTGADAPLVVKQVDRSGRMPNPETPDESVLYDFSLWPGIGGGPGSGNSVISGNVDSGTQPCRGGSQPPPCQAVFWSLPLLVTGDRVVLFWDRTAYEFTVVNACWAEARVSPDALLRTTESETLTLITAGGSFTPGAGYSHRLYVRAERTAGSLARECAVGEAQAPPNATPTPRP